MLLDRHRVARLIELSELARTLTGPERMLREEEVSILIKAAYDDASDAARRLFVEQVNRLPPAAWPWSAVKADGGPPPLLILLLGQAVSADLDPGNRIPDRGLLGSAGFEGLHQALQRWDTATIRKSIGPQGWVAASPGPTASAASRSPGHTPRSSAMNMAPKGKTPTGGGGAPPGRDVPTSGTPTGGVPPGGEPPPAGDVLPGSEPAPESLPANVDPTWTRGAYIAAGVVGIGALGLTWLAVHRSMQEREMERLRALLREFER